jgi:hypothetical protein
VTAFSTPRDSTAPTPNLHKSSSKRDLQKQLKLSKTVSDLERKLAKARKELSETLGEHEPLPSIPSVSAFPPTPDTSTSHFFSQDEVSPHPYTHQESVSKPNKIVKKRKASGISEDEYKPITTESESDFGSDFTTNKAKSTATTKTVSIGKSSKRRKANGKLSKKRSNITKDEVVIVVPDGVTVPPIPMIPHGTEGKLATVSKEDDGFGGLGHEIF